LRPPFASVRVLQSENNEFVSKLGSLYPARAMARQIANVALARCAAPSRLIRMAIDGGISRISSQSVSDRRRLKIGAVPGHLEGDLLSGPNNGYIATLVERHTRYVMFAKVAGTLSLGVGRGVS
jgi:hypothetical protein